MAVPHTLQNLSDVLTTVPHCVHALMVSPVCLLRVGPPFAGPGAR
jgi:hypothetical protein